MNISSYDDHHINIWWSSYHHKAEKTLHMLYIYYTFQSEFCIVVRCLVFNICVYLGNSSVKYDRNFMKKFHKMVTPLPPSCIDEILIQIFYRKFCDKIKMRQNSVNHPQSHPKFWFSTRLMQWTPKIWGRAPLNERVFEIWLVWQSSLKCRIGSCKTCHRHWTHLRILWTKDISSSFWHWAIPVLSFAK